MTTAADVEEARAIHVKLVATAVLIDRLDRELARGDVGPAAALAMVRQVRLIVEAQHAQLDFLRARRRAPRVLNHDRQTCSRRPADVPLAEAAPAEAARGRALQPSPGGHEMGGAAPGAPLRPKRPRWTAEWPNPVSRQRLLKRGAWPVSILRWERRRWGF